MKKLAFFLVLVACVFVFGTESVSSQLKAFTDGQAAELQEWETRQQENQHGLATPRRLSGRRAWRSSSENLHCRTVNGNGRSDSTCAIAG